MGMTVDEILQEFENAINAHPATFQIRCEKRRTASVFRLFDECEERVRKRGWLVGRVALRKEEEKYPGMPIHYHLEETIKDWLHAPMSNDKLLLGIIGAQGHDKIPALLLIDGADFPDDQRLINVKQQVRDINNRLTELNLWIIFAVDARSSERSPSV